MSKSVPYLGLFYQHVEPKLNQQNTTRICTTPQPLQSFQNAPVHQIEPKLCQSRWD